MALSDANAEINRRGLEKSGRTWRADRLACTSHDIKTIQSLVDIGYLKLYVGQTVAHITDSGQRSLELEVSNGSK